MAILFKNNIDLGLNQLLSVLLQKEPDHPSNPVAGQVYFNTTSGKAFVYSGSAWVGMDADAASMSGSDILDAINGLASGTINEARLSITHPTKSSLGLDQVNNVKQIEALALNSTTDGHIPAWDGKNGDKLKAGYSVDTASLSSGASAFATSQVIKSYVDGLVGAVEGLVYKGVKDASSNPTWPAGTKGDVWKVSKAGKFGGPSGEPVEIGDMLICLNTTVGGIAADWNTIQANIDGAVIGPTSAGGDNIAIFNGATGKLIKDSGLKTSAFSQTGHTHPYTSKFSANLTANATQTVTHGLNTEDVVVMIRETSGSKQQIYADVKITGVNTISISMATAPTANQYRVTVIG